MLIQYIKSNEYAGLNDIQILAINITFNSISGATNEDVSAGQHQSQCKYFMIILLTQH